MGAAGTPITGKDGNVQTATSTDLNDTQRWTLNQGGVVNEYGSSGTDGWTGTTAGRKRYSGSVEALFDSAAAEGMTELALVTLNLFTKAGQKYAGQARITNVRIGVVDIDATTNIPIVFDWVSHGPWTKPTFA